MSASCVSHRLDQTSRRDRAANAQRSEGHLSLSLSLSLKHTHKHTLGWQICRIEDYLVATRCFKCSKFNYRTQDCRGEVTCLLCAGPHTLLECSGDSKIFKCTNCVNYNKHNPTKSIIVAHSSLDKKCSSLHAVIEKYKLNTEY